MSTRIAPLLVSAILIVACDPFSEEPTPEPLLQVPAPSQIQVVGTITGQSQRQTTVDYTLADGRIITVDLDTRRMVGQEGGSPALLVLGRDAQGDWIALPGHQDGLPDGCHVMSQDGHELGDSIAIAGILWLKARGFSVPFTPPMRFPYPPGSRFCLDGQARVASVIGP
jgi:hypothetical protein